MGTLRELKFKMKSDKDLRPMLVRSMRHELLIDLDGDKVADIALIDSNRDGDLDTIAVDTTGNGDFNLYIGDQDANGVPDTVEFYDDGDDMPIAAYFGRAVEDRFIDLAGIIYARVLAKEFIASEMISAFKDFVARAEEEYEKVKAADDAESEEAKEDETAEAAELSKDAE